MIKQRGAIAAVNKSADSMRNRERNQIKNLCVSVLFLSALGNEIHLMLFDIDFIHLLSHL